LTNDSHFQLNLPESSEQPNPVTPHKKGVVYWSSDDDAKLDQLQEAVLIVHAKDLEKMRNLSECDRKHGGLFGWIKRTNL
jgi:hypothetical protein